uniref:asparagine--tRNA ligase n=1 Tax=Strigamia maritima TaxID=126957 RepID=T1J1R4_STRMM
MAGRRLYSTLKTLSFLHNTQPVNTKVQVQGWIKRLIKQKEMLFIDLVDGSVSERLQIVAEPSLKTSDLTYGSVVVVDGQLVASSHPKQKIELKAEKITVLGTCDPEKFPFRYKGDYDFGYIRDFLHLRSRTQPFQSLLKVRNEAIMRLHSYFQENCFYLIQTPILTSNNCEGGGEIFEVQAPKETSPTSAESDETSDEEISKESKESKDGFFATKVYLTVSGQLQLETVACGGIPKVYNIGPAFRAEKNRTQRHLSEFYMLEAEIAFAYSLNDIVELIEDMIKTTTEKILFKCEQDVKHLIKYQGAGDHLNKLKTILKTPFSRCSYSEAVNLLRTNVGKFKTAMEWGMRLQKEHENFIVKSFGNRPVFVTDFPSLEAPFYMKSNEDETKTVAAVDLLVPVVGELCGGSLREDDFQLLRDKCKTMHDLDWYLELRQFATVPHGGFGMGIERYLQFVTGVVNIRDTIPFPRWSQNCKM